jgi:hypothetical protein
MPPYRDWESEEAEAARIGPSRSIQRPRSRDKDGCRSPLRRHQTVLEGAVPLSLNVPMESSFRGPTRVAEARVVAPDDAPELGSASRNSKLRGTFVDRRGSLERDCRCAIPAHDRLCRRSSFRQLDILRIVFPRR